MSQIAPAVAGQSNFLVTARRDNWWAAPLTMGLALAAFIAYSLWAGLIGEHYQAGPYLSPFYSPLIVLDWWPFSPAILILWVPIGFRTTCYYYRKAYYRAFFMTPPACAVGAKPQNYRGESFLLLFQNLHRYFLLPALALIVFLTHDAIVSFRFSDGLGIGVGSIVLTLNALFLAIFTFGCNSLRHLIGGGVDCYSCVSFGKARHRGWKIVSRFNAHHMTWAWISLFWVGLSDLYVRLLSMGIITDLRIL